MKTESIAWIHAPMRGLAVMVACALGLSLAACGSGPKRPPLLNPLPDPVPGDPWFGLEGNVLISDRGFLFNTDGEIDQIWIGFNDPGEFQTFLTLLATHGEAPNFNIGGKVVADLRGPDGYYFDPNTTLAAEVFAEATMTTLDQIKQDPATFALNLPGLWNVPAVVEKVIPSSP